MTPREQKKEYNIVTVVVMVMKKIKDCKQHNNNAYKKEGLTIRDGLFFCNKNGII
jgi:hypothetical protein